MMKHINMLAEFSTGMEVRIGHPDEHLTKSKIADIASPMYATGIGLVIETLARMEHDEHLRASQEAARAKKLASRTKTNPDEIEVDDPEETKEPEPEEVKTSFSTRIITRLSNLFKPDDIK